ncbi:hypothetical protein [Microbacterium paulum]
MRGIEAHARASRGARAVRGTVAAGTAVLIAGTAHTLSGGGAPPAWLMVGIAILAAPLCMLLVGRRASRRGLAAAVAAAQLALHAAFAAVGSAAPTTGGVHDAMAAHAAHTHLLPFLTNTASALDPAASLMTLGHAVATLVTFAALAWGERLLAAVARGILRVLRPARAPRPARPASAPALFLPRHTAAEALFLHSVTRRGPPERFALAAA